MSIPDKAQVLITNVTFENNSAPVGGAVSIINTPQVTLMNSRFIKNSGNDGAAIYLSNSGAPLSIINTVFDGNYAKASIFSIVSGITTLD